MLLVDHFDYKWSQSKVHGLGLRTWTTHNTINNWSCYILVALGMVHHSLNC